jgi:hypothetical protein
MTTRGSINFKPNRLWIMTPPIGLAFADAGVTLFFQSSEYWARGFHMALENNPIAAVLIKLHPAIFLAGILIWSLIIAALVIHLPHPWELVVAFTGILGHTWGIMSWFYVRASMAYWPRMSFFLFVAVLTVICWLKADRKQI